MIYRIVGVAMTAIVLGCSSVRPADLLVTDWAAKSGPLFPHSAIVEGRTEIGVVDVQQSKAEAHRLVADILERGKVVRWIYITHPHLDHFAGANILRAAFPAAKFYGPSASVNREMARQVATRRLPLGQGTPGGAYNLPERAPNYFLAVPKDGLKIDGARVEVLRGKGDHPDSSIVWIPSAKTIVGGDVIFHKTHAFFGDHDDIDAWIELVERANRLQAATVVAGHSKTLNPGGEIVARQLAWLMDLRAAMNQKDEWQHVKAVMTAKYPEYSNDFIFEFSYNVKAAKRK